MGKQAELSESALSLVPAETGQWSDLAAARALRSWCSGEHAQLDVLRRTRTALHAPENTHSWTHLHRL